MLILAGGATSGKSFITNNVLLFDGKTFNVDDLKDKFIALARKNPNCKFAQKFKEDTGLDLANLDLKNGKHVYALHIFIQKLQISDKSQKLFFLAQRSSTTKPNVIFDMTLKEMERLEEVSGYAEKGGYDKKNIHIVWVLTDIYEAISNNKLRSRSVPEDILVQTHLGAKAKMTMLELINNSKEYEKWMDGDIWIVFNRKGLDSRVRFTQSKGLSGKEDKRVAHLDPNVGAIKNSDKLSRGYVAIHLKEAGKPSKKISEIDQFFRDRIETYTKR